MAHQCTKCELVFANRAELEDHLDVDHAAGPSDATGVPGPSEEVTEAIEAPPSSSGARRGWLDRLLGRKRD